MEAGVDGQWSGDMMHTDLGGLGQWPPRYTTTKFSFSEEAMLLIFLLYRGAGGGGKNY